MHQIRGSRLNLPSRNLKTRQQLSCDLQQLQHEMKLWADFPPKTSKENTECAALLHYCAKCGNGEMNSCSTKDFKGLYLTGRMRMQDPLQLASPCKLGSFLVVKSDQGLLGVPAALGSSMCSSTGPVSLC